MDAKVPQLALTLPASWTAPREARRALHAWLLMSQCGQETAQTAELLATELITNVVRHTPSSALCLSAELDGGHVRVSVRDGWGQDSLPRRGRTHTPAGGGRGLMLVKTLASDWGWELHPEGKDVWFELAIAETAR
ncbi:MAG: hypothetical protein QOJ90_2496 [Actinomycetota bacterium]|jgi:anti-sigma regulatory factor (Ser/Thr protein kinase)|nr:hypothetical protein [Actinomycetota bacterium]